MAESRFFVCNSCGKEVEAWSDGNPYYIGDNGKKHYAYHPDHVNLAKCIGNDTPHLCLSCGHEFNVDSNYPSSTCIKCDSSKVSEAFKLNGKRCPVCKTGFFCVDPDRYSIS